MDAEAKDTTLTLEYQPIGHNGKVRLTARLPDGASYTDKFDCADAEGRARFIRGLCKGHAGIDLTMSVYTDPSLLDVAGAVEALPSFTAKVTTVTPMPANAC